jgi:Fe(3+) dicitrate transport protein
MSRNSLPHLLPAKRRAPVQHPGAAAATLAIVHSILLAGAGIQAQETSSAVRLPDVVVTGAIIGGEEEARQLPGSATYLGEQQIREFNQTDVNRVLREVPGVYVREEDGYGNFPNISLRGVTTVRNTKITVMEDGILSAPAPYSDPAAYYTPAVGRMVGLEVIKGSSQIKYGPQITGGVLNFRSTPVPLDRSGLLKVHAGSHSEIFGLGHYGDTVEVGEGRLGFLAEGFYHRADGFKTVDAAPGVDRHRTGFERIEPMIKLSYELRTAAYQRLEAKYGYTDFKADETYLGLTEEDFKANPYRRYAATRFDTIPTEQHRVYLRHVIRPTDQFQVTTTGYYNQFERAWFKLNDVRLQGDTTWRNLSETLAGAHGANNALGVLRAEEAGQLRSRNNQRSYYAWGVEQTYRYQFDTGPVEHTLDGGIRYHYDQSSRFQHDTVFNQDATGTIVSSVVGAPGSQDNRKQDSAAWAFHLQDRLDFGRWSVTPGVRYEHITYSQINYNVATPVRQKGSQDVFAGGIGADYEVTRDLTAFAGVHRGFAIPGPGGALTNNLEEETSVSTEVGMRYRAQSGFAVEGIYFFTAFRDLIVDSNAGGGGGGITENAGDVDVHGFELALKYDPGLARNWIVRVPLGLAFTYTDARFISDAISVGAGGGPVESIFSGAQRGNRVPYVPEYQINARIGLEYDRYGLHLNASYVPETFATGSNTSLQMRPDGTPDARFGKTDSYFLLDLTAQVQLNENASLFAGVRNLADWEYVASRIPHGPRPGLPRTFYGGVEFRF